MSVQAGTNIKKNYLPVFEEYPDVTGFFSLKDGAVEGSPYNNPEMFRQLGLEDAVRVCADPDPRDSSGCDPAGGCGCGESCSGSGNLADAGRFCSERWRDEKSYASQSRSRRSKARRSKSR